MSSCFVQREEKRSQGTCRLQEHGDSPQQQGQTKRGHHWDRAQQAGHQDLSPSVSCLEALRLCTVPINLRFPDERKHLESAEDQSLDLSVAHLWLLVLAQEMPPALQGSAYREIKELEASGLINEQSFSQWTKITPCSHCPCTGNGGFEGFLYAVGNVSGYPVRMRWVYV